MELELGCPMYLAIILSKPKFMVKNDVVRFRARFHGKTRAFMVECRNKELLNCHRGDEVWLDVYGEETGEIIAHNPLMRWFVQFWY